MKFVVVAVSIFAIIGLIQCNAVDKLHPISPVSRINQEQTCTRPGIMCDGCYKSVACVKNGDNFEKILVETCKDGQTCTNGNCYNFVGPGCELELKFPCNNVGVFPDPYDCKTYHFCVRKYDGSLRDYKARCDEGYGYDILSGLCSVQLEDNVCYGDYHLSPCHHSGQTDALYSNKNIYYICAQYSEENPILYPFLYACPHGSQYSYFECASNVKENFDTLMRRF